VQRISRLEDTMLIGVAIVATSIIVSALIAGLIGSICEAVAERRWLVDLPPWTVAVAAMSVAAGGLIGV
jgi:hypothetical protein